MDKLSTPKECFEAAMKEILKADTPEIAADNVLTTTLQKALSLGQTMTENQKRFTTSLHGTKSSKEAEHTAAISSVQQAIDENQHARETVAKLVENCTNMENELSEARSDLEKTDASSSEVLREALKDVPLEKYVCNLLRNITNIEWDVGSCQDKSVAKGSFVTKNEIKSFDFELKTNQLHDVQEKLWDMMGEGEKFASAGCLDTIDT